MDVETIEKLNEIGIALSSERNIAHLLGRILTGAKDITNADAGSLYSMTQDDSLRFEIVLNDTLGLAMGGYAAAEVCWAPIPLHDETGCPNTRLIVVYAVTHNVTVNIPDVYKSAEKFDFSGTRTFDREFGYQSRSLLAVPLTDSENQVIGVFQLINAQGRAGSEIVPFSREQQRLVESLASQAAVALTRYRLAQDQARSRAAVLVFNEHTGEQDLFSAPNLAARLEAYALSKKAAREISQQVYRHLLERKQSEISVDELDQLTHQELSKGLGAKVARRLPVWKRFRQSGRPLFLLIGGATGTGKSTVAAELARRLGIERIHSTDTLREVMRLMVSEAIAPALHCSSYSAWKAVFDGHAASRLDNNILIIEGYKAQARTVTAAIDGVIKRAMEENVSCIIEGVHLHPSYKERIQAQSEAVVVPIMLAVPDRLRFKSYFKSRGRKASARDTENHLRHVDTIWQLQAYFLSEAERCRIPVIPNLNQLQTVRQILGIVTETLEQEF